MMVHSVSAAGSEGSTPFGLLMRVGPRWRAVPVTEFISLGSGAEMAPRVPGLAARHCHVRVGRRGLRFTALDGEVSLTSSRHGREVTPGELVFLGEVPAVCVRMSDVHGSTQVELGGFASCYAELWSLLGQTALVGWGGAPTFIGGESGTGKELLARVVHDCSPRREGPYVAINCGALPGGLLEAELFGARRGAYTGSVHDRVGAFERADGGTLFLDEVAELSPSAQAALLRVLDQGSVQVVGGPCLDVNVRVVAATHQDLRQRVAAGLFRLDLFHRLAVCELKSVPLRSRPRDQSLLFHQFFGRPLPAGTQSILAGHRWDGNVRELRNVATRLRVYRPIGKVTLDDVAAAMGSSGSGVDKLQWVRTCLDSSPTVSAAQRRSGLSRSTFFRYLKEVRTHSVNEPRVS